MTAFDGGREEWEPRPPSILKDIACLFFCVLDAFLIVAVMAIVLAMME